MLYCVSVQACNRQGLWCVPLYDTLGEDAVEYIIRHADVPIVFTAGDKFPGLVRALEPVKNVVKAVVVWGKIDPNAKKVGCLCHVSRRLIWMKLVYLFPSVIVVVGGGPSHR
jgi:long-subunit acyl-CoA synthetase (AMP-forming)